MVHSNSLSFFVGEIKLEVVVVVSLNSELQTLCTTSLNFSCFNSLHDCCSCVVLLTAVGLRALCTEL